MGQILVIVGLPRFYCMHLAFPLYSSLMPLSVSTRSVICFVLISKHLLIILAQRKWQVLFENEIIGIFTQVVQLEHAFVQTNLSIIANLLQPPVTIWLQVHQARSKRVAASMQFVLAAITQLQAGP